MENKNRFAFVYLILAVALLLGWSYFQGWMWPRPKPPEKATTGQLLGFVAQHGRDRNHRAGVP